MKFTPMTDQELQVAALVPEGAYSYQVVKAEDKISQAGNEYISLTIKVWDDEGKEHSIFTNLAFVKLLKHFSDVNDLQDLYQMGDIPAERCLGKSGGKVLLGIEGEKPDGKGGMYRAKNIVKDYINLAGSKLMPIRPVTQTADDFLNDALPF